MDGPRSQTLRSLYVCYLSLDDPLVQTQVVAYLEGLARRGHLIHLLTFEPPMAGKRRSELRADLARRGITWHALRYHKWPSLPATALDIIAGSARSVRLVRRHRLDVVHARSHVPVVMGLITRRLTRCRLIFDIRGLMAEEYADAGRWARDGVAYRLTNRVQRAGIGAADGTVVLTHSVHRQLFGESSRPRSQVIPCCTALTAPDRPVDPAAVRARLALGDRPVMVYVGKLARRYMEAEMVAFFAAARRALPGLVFLVLTQSEAQSLTEELARASVSEADYRLTRVAPQELGDYLAVASFAICFYRPAACEIGASPTKLGEYLSAGLPVVTSSGVGDTDDIVRKRGVGVVVDPRRPAEFDSAARAVVALADDPSVRERCASTARELFSLEQVGIPRYDRLYRDIAAISDPSAR